MQVSVTKLGLCKQKEEILAFVKGKLLVTQKFAGVVIRESLAGIANFWEHQQRRKFRLLKLDNFQVLDYEALEGRLLSSSYIPLSGPKFDELINELKDIHKNYNSNGLVTLEYETVIYAGSLS